MKLETGLPAVYSVTPLLIALAIAVDDVCES